MKLLFVSVGGSRIFDHSSLAAPFSSSKLERAFCRNGLRLWLRLQVWCPREIWRHNKDSCLRLQRSCFLIFSQTAPHFHHCCCCNNESGRAHYTGSRFEIERVSKCVCWFINHTTAKGQNTRPICLRNIHPGWSLRSEGNRFCACGHGANSVEMRADGVLHTPRTTRWCSSTADTFKSTFQTIGTIKTPLNVSCRRHVVL